MPLTSGSKLGPYEIQSPLGAGGMGEVYRARDTRLGREVAIKVLPQHLSASPDLRERFEREARAISSLNHPRICTLHDVGREGGIDFLVMEYLEGESLAERLRHGPLPLKLRAPRFPEYPSRHRWSHKPRSPKRVRYAHKPPLTTRQLREADPGVVPC